MQPAAATGGEGTPLPPALLLRPDVRDWYALLILWCVRQAARALLIVGLIPVAVAGQLREDLVARLDSPLDLLQALWSPLVIMAVAVILRVASSLVALVIAFPIQAGDTFDLATTPERTRWMAAYDRLILASGKRSLRWSWAVRRTAALRLGHAGQLLDYTGRVLTWCTPAALLALVLVVRILD